MDVDVKGERLHCQVANFLTAHSDVSWLLVITLVELEIYVEESLLVCFSLSM